VPVSFIDDPSDHRFADYRNIPDHELVRSRGVFVAEGRLVVRRLLESSFGTRSVMVTRPAFDTMADLVTARPGLPVYVVSPEVMSTVAGFNIHRGCLAIGMRPAPRPWSDLAPAATRLVALERVGNADNVGTTFRCAAAFGIDGVLLGPGCADPLYRKAIRTSMGAALHVPFATSEPWPEALAHLRDDGWTVVGLTPAAEAAPVSRVLTSGPGARTMLVLGHEGDGLSEGAMRACTHLARIPMARGVDSLNVSMAAGVALYELTRGTYTQAP
jgi:tRNA G18 (ribose-2'-O)-methylase SpoU